MGDNVKNLLNEYLRNKNRQGSYDVRDELAEYLRLRNSNISRHQKEGSVYWDRFLRGLTLGHYPPEPMVKEAKTTLEKVGGFGLEMLGTVPAFVVASRISGAGIGSTGFSGTAGRVLASAGTGAIIGGVEPAVDERERVVHALENAVVFGAFEIGLATLKGLKNLIKRMRIKSKAIDVDAEDLDEIVDIVKQLPENTQRRVIGLLPEYTKKKIEEEVFKGQAEIWPRRLPGWDKVIREEAMPGQTVRQIRAPYDLGLPAAREMKALPESASKTLAGEKGIIVRTGKGAGKARVGKIEEGDEVLRKKDRERFTVVSITDKQVYLRRPDAMGFDVVPKGKLLLGYRLVRKGEALPEVIKGPKGELRTESVRMGDVKGMQLGLERPSISVKEKKIVPVKGKLNKAIVQVDENTKLILQGEIDRLKQGRVHSGRLIEKDREVVGRYGRYSTNPEWYKNVYGVYNKREVISTLEKVIGGKALTPRQQDIWERVRDEIDREYKSYEMRGEVSGMEQKGQIDLLEGVDLGKGALKKDKDVVFYEDLKVGDEFKIDGEKYRVIEKEKNKLVVKDRSEYVLEPGFSPLDIDKGSLVSGQVSLKKGRKVSNKKSRWMKAKEEAERAVAEIGDEWVPGIGGIMIDKMREKISEIAKKYGVPETTLRRQTLWEIKDDGVKLADVSDDALIFSIKARREGLNRLLKIFGKEIETKRTLGREFEEYHKNKYLLEREIKEARRRGLDLGELSVGKRGKDVVEVKGDIPPGSPSKGGKIVYPEKGGRGLTKGELTPPAFNARKLANGKYGVFYAGTNNRVEIGGKTITKEFDSAKEARAYVKAEWVKYLQGRSKGLEKGRGDVRVRGDIRRDIEDLSEQVHYKPLKKLVDKLKYYEDTDSWHFSGYLGGWDRRNIASRVLTINEADYVIKKGLKDVSELKRVGGKDILGTDSNASTHILHYPVGDLAIRWTSDGRIIANFTPIRQLKRGKAVRDVSEGYLKGKGVKEDLGKEVVKKAKEYFGVTVNYREAGYITPDGKMLDFSGKKQGLEAGSRSLDHSEIRIALGEFEDVLGKSNWDLKESFMRMGNIRVSPEVPLIDMVKEPTREQVVTLKRLINGVDGKIDVELEKAGEKFFKEYEKGTSAKRIIEDIINFFRGKGKGEGIVRRFHGGISKEDIIEETRLAYGSVEEAKRIIKELADEIDKTEISREALAVRRQKTASQVSKALRKKGYIDYRGQVVRTPEDVAQIARVFRDPTVEHFHVIYVDKNNKVLGHNIITSGANDYVGLGRKNVYRIESAAKRLNAKSVWIAHNHPGGKSSPSSADIGFTLGLRSNIEKHGIKLKGHVVTDHDDYHVIKTIGNRDYVVNKYKWNAEKLIKPLSEFISSPQDVVRETKSIVEKAQGKAAILYLTSRSQIVDIDFVNKELLVKESLYDVIKRGMKRSGTSQYIIEVHSDVNKELDFFRQTRNVKLPSGYLDGIILNEKNELVWGNYFLYREESVGGGIKEGRFIQDVGAGYSRGGGRENIIRELENKAGKGSLDAIRAAIGLNKAIKDFSEREFEIVARHLRRLGRNKGLPKSEVGHRYLKIGDVFLKRKEDGSFDFWRVKAIRRKVAELEKVFGKEGVGKVSIRTYDLLRKQMDDIIPRNEMSGYVGKPVGQQGYKIDREMGAILPGEESHSVKSVLKRFGERFRQYLDQLPEDKFDEINLKRYGESAWKKEVAGTYAEKIEKAIENDVDEFLKGKYGNKVTRKDVKDTAIDLRGAVVLNIQKDGFKSVHEWENAYLKAVERVQDPVTRDYLMRIKGIIDENPDILKKYTKIFREDFESQKDVLLDEGLKEDFIENYVTQMWQMDKGASLSSIRLKMKTQFEYAKRRLIPDYLTGIGLGMKPRGLDIVAINESYKKALAETLANRRFVQRLKGLYVDAGEGDVVKALITKKQFEDMPSIFQREYTTVNHAAFKGFYAHQAIVKDLRKIFEESVLRQWVPSRKYMMMNQFLKRAKLAASGFHHVALGFNNVFFHADKWYKIGNPLPWDFGPWKSGYKKGIEEYLKANPIVKFGVESGLTLRESGTMSDYYFRFKRNVMSWPEQKGIAKSIKEAVKNFVHVWDDALWNKYYVGSKVTAFMMEYGRNLKLLKKKYPELYEEWAKAGFKKNFNTDYEKLAAQLAARDVNTLYGGLNYELMKISKTAQDFFRGILLAPDWQLSNWTYTINGLRGMTGGGGKKGVTVAAGRKLFKIIIVLGVMGNLINRKITGKWVWENPEGYKGMVAISKDGDRVYYVDLYRHFGEPLKVVKYGNPNRPTTYFYDSPIRYLVNKSSQMIRVIDAIRTGQDWRGRPLADWKAIAEGKGYQSKYIPWWERGSVLPGIGLVIGESFIPIPISQVMRAGMGDESWVIAGTSVFGIHLKEYDKSRKGIGLRKRYNKRLKGIGAIKGY